MLPGTEQIKAGEAALIDHDGLAVNDTRAHWEALQCGGDLRIARRKIEAVTGEQPHAVAVAPSENAKTIVFDLVNPTGAGRRGVCPSRKAGLQRDGGLNAPSLGP